MTHRIFGRINSDGNVDIMDSETGEAVTRLDADVYPIGSDLSARYEHPDGIVLAVADAETVGVEIEGATTPL
jgi:hypothetical protein